MHHLRSLRLWAVVSLVLFMAIGAVIIWGAYLGWTFKLKPHDRATVVTVAIAIDALLFGLLAAALALVAYMAASGQPDLGIDVEFPGCEPNRPVLLLNRDTASRNPGFANVGGPGGSGMATITVKNKSTYAARNPGVRITCHGFGLVGTHLVDKGWTVVKAHTNGSFTVVQWDGGTDNIVHGTWTRQLPSLTFGSAYVDLRSSYRVEVTLVADGALPKTVVIPIEFRFPDGNAVATNP